MPADSRSDSILWEDFEAPEEVEALLRAQRRLSVRYGLLFLLGTAVLPLLNALWPPWVERPLLGGLTPAFLATTFLYPCFCVLVGAGYMLRANRLDEEFLARPSRSDAPDGI